MTGMLGKTIVFGILTVLGALWRGAVVQAAEPTAWGMGLQPAVTPVMERVEDLHGLLLTVIVVITVFVLALLGYVAWRFRAGRNPEPSKTTHNVPLEIAWTVIPVLILIAIAVPSFKLLYYMDKAVDAEMTLKVVGHQWYWSYEYPDHGDFTFDAVMVTEDELEDGQRRLLETDNQVVLPVETDIRLLFTSDDVLHAWAVPAFGVKVDAVPGRINEAWVRVGREGTYYGQCSELCGVNHGAMPIAVKVVSKEAFTAWVGKAKVEFAEGNVTKPDPVHQPVHLAHH
jgi:cytochrome c oxidase subunit II